MLGGNWWTQSVWVGQCWGMVGDPYVVSWWNAPPFGSVSSWRPWWACLSWWRPHTSPHTWHSGRLCSCSPGRSLWRCSLCLYRWPEEQEEHMKSVPLCALGSILSLECWAVFVFFFFFLLCVDPTATLFICSISTVFVWGHKQKDNI